MGRLIFPLSFCVTFLFPETQNKLLSEVFHCQSEEKFVYIYFNMCLKNQLECERSRDQDTSAMKMKMEWRGILNGEEGGE